MKKSLCLCFLLLTSLPAFAAEEDIYCSGEQDFELFTCRVENICEPYKPEKPTIKPEKYEEADSFAQSYV